MTPISRRNFLHSTAAASAVALTPPLPQTQTPPAFSTLKPLGDRAHPITAHEFHARLLRTQSLMSRSNPAFDAILSGPSTSLYSFTPPRSLLTYPLPPPLIAPTL